MATYRDWSVTASANTGTSANGFFAEGMAYSGVNDAAREFQAILARDRNDKNGTIIAGGSTSSYVLSVASNISTYRDGDYYRFTAHVKNDGPTTLQVSTLSARPVVKTDLSALADREIVAGGTYEVFYKSASANFQLLNPSSPGWSPTWVAAGSTSSYVLSVVPAISAYRDGDYYRFHAHVKNDGATTLQVSTLSARPVVKTDLSALSDRDIVAGGTYEVYYKSASANFQLVNPSPGWMQGSAAHDFSSLDDGAGETITLTVTGAALGDFAVASLDKDLGGMQLSAYVSAANTVTVRVQNELGYTVNVDPGTLRARVWKA